ncbi:MAG: ATP-binding protein [Bacteroidaceae bacterium]|nr:ATP-binding protein [Bacteroidaceae bacterium]
MVKNLVGPPVTGENFVGRTNEITKAVSILEQGNSLLLASPRRVGKSSFSQKMLDIFAKKDYKTIYFDLQGINSEQEFGDRLADKLQEIQNRESALNNLKDKIEKFFRKVKKLDVKGIGVEFRTDPEMFYKSVESLLELDENFLIVVDELAIFLQTLEETSGFERVESFMNWFRRIRIDRREKIGWILCSSVSITNYVSKNRISHTINDVVSLNLGEMSTEEATELLQKLCDGAAISRFSKEQINIILERIGWKLPFFIQSFFQHYKSGLKQEQYAELPTENITDSIIEQIIREHQVSSWSERLSGYGKYERSAQTLLNYLCQPTHISRRNHLETIIARTCPKGDDVGVVLAEVKQMLENDGYLMETGEGEIVFRSPIIRQYWFTKFVK